MAGDNLTVNCNVVTNHVQMCCGIVVEFCLYDGVINAKLSGIKNIKSEIDANLWLGSRIRRKIHRSVWSCPQDRTPRHKSK